LTTSLTTFLLLYTLQLTSDAGHHSILTILIFKRPIELFTLLSVHAMYLYVA
jgi:hypothetical protein